MRKCFVFVALIVAIIATSCKSEYKKPSDGAIDKAMLNTNYMVVVPVNVLERIRSIADSVYLTGKTSFKLESDSLRKSIENSGYSDMLYLEEANISRDTINKCKIIVLNKYVPSDAEPDSYYYLDQFARMKKYLLYDNGDIEILYGNYLKPSFSVDENRCTRLLIDGRTGLLLDFFRSHSYYSTKYFSLYSDGEFRGSPSSVNKDRLLTRMIFDLRTLLRDGNAAK